MVAALDSSPAHLLPAHAQSKDSWAAETDRSRIHERSISLRFLGIILRVLRLGVSVYDVYITNQFQTTFALGVGGGGERKICECE